MSTDKQIKIAVSDSMDEARLKITLSSSKTFREQIPPSIILSTNNTQTLIGIYEDTLELKNKMLTRVRRMENESFGFMISVWLILIAFLCYSSLKEEDTMLSILSPVTWIIILVIIVASVAVSHLWIKRENKLVSKYMGDVEQLINSKSKPLQPGIQVKLYQRETEDLCHEAFRYDIWKDNHCARMQRLKVLEEQLEQVEILRIYIQ